MPIMVHLVNRYSGDAMQLSILQNIWLQAHYCTLVEAMVVVMVVVLVVVERGAEADRGADTCAHIHCVTIDAQYVNTPPPPLAIL